MKSRRSSFSYLAALAVFFLVASGVGYFIVTSAPDALLRAQIENFVVRDTSVDGQIYVLRDSKGAINRSTPPEALQVAYTAILARIDPILGLEGTDPQKMLEGVVELRAKAVEIAQYYAPEEASEIRDLLFPSDFLEAAAKAEGLRQELIQHPADASADAYYNQLESSLNEALIYGERLTSLFSEGGIFAKTPGKFVYFGGATTIAQYALALKEYRENIQLLKNDLILRKRCLRDFDSTCPSLSDAFTKFTSAQTPPSLPPTEPPSEVLSNGRLLSSFLSGAPLSDTQQPTIVALPKSACFPHFADTYFLIRQRDDGAGHSIFQNALISDLYFYETKSFTDDRRATPEIRKRIAYMYQPATNPYMCVQSGDDYTRALTLDTVYAEIMNQRLTHAGKPISEDTSYLEAAIASSTVINETQVSRYLDAARQALASEGEVGLAFRLGTERLFAIERMMSISNQRSARFDEAIRHGISHQHAVTDFGAMGQPIPLYVVFLARSYFPLLSLSHNKSLAPATLPVSIPEQFDISKFRLVSYNDLVGREMTPQETLDMMLLHTQLEKSAKK